MGGVGERSRRLYEAGKAALAERFDAGRGLIRAETDLGVFHLTRESLGYARCLLHDCGRGDADAALGARIIDQVLAVQERQPGNIHEGNFPWMADDGYVADLNAVEFCLEQLCAIVRESDEKLPAATRTAIRAAMHLGLAEIARLDVGVEYTNICLLDCHNSILGGQILGARGWVEQGERKLARWAAYTAASGAPREYNSPTYAGVDLHALAEIGEHADDRATRLLARLMEERLWLHAATHYHAPTAQVAGPHSRAYQNDVTGGRGSLKTTMYKLLGDEALIRKTPFYPLRQGEGHVSAALAEYHCPEPVVDLLRGGAYPFTVRETVDAALGMDLSTTVAADWALGVASREYSAQSDNLMLHYRKDAEPGFGVLYTRFILNDRRLGGTLHATDRTRSNNIADVGAFRGLHFRDKAIGVYGLLPQHENVSSIKLDVFVPGREGLGRVLIGGQLVGSLPCEVPPGVPLIIEDGAVYVGVLPLRHSNLGRSAPVRLEAEEEDLVLSTVIYEGPEKRFWEYSALGGPFYRGNIECGVVVEVAERGRFPDAVAFAAHLAAATVEDAVAEGVRQVRYASGGDELLLRYRLDDMAIVERRVNGERIEAVPLDAPFAVQRHASPLVLGGIRLDAPVEPSANWLYRNPDGSTIVATRATATPGPFALRLPDGRAVGAPALGLARVTCRFEQGEVEVEYSGPDTVLSLVGWGDNPALILNGEEVSGRLRRGAEGELLLAIP